MPPGRAAVSRSAEATAHVSNRAALTRLVTESFNASSAAARELKAVVLDLDDTFWPLLPQFITIMQPLRLAIHTLQGDHAKLSDVMAAYVRIHHEQTTFMASAECHLSASTKLTLGSVFRRRFKFLYHPVHLIAFALDPRYAKLCKAAPSVIRHWAKKLHGVADDEAALINEYGRFCASMNDPAQADIWTPQAMEFPLIWWRSWGDEFPTLSLLARKVLSLPPSAASAERNWSTHEFIISKRRNRLAPQRSNKLVYIYFNLRSLAQADPQRRGPGVTLEALERWHSSVNVHANFSWPSEADGEHMYVWDVEDDDEEFDGMHGDEMESDEDNDEEADAREADRQEEVPATRLAPNTSAPCAISHASSSHTLTLPSGNGQGAIRA